MTKLNQPPNSAAPKHILRAIKTSPSAILPRRWSEDAVGWDLHAHILSETGRQNKVLIPPRNTRNISTGIAIEPPRGFFTMVCSRSGLAKYSIFVANAPGIIDPDFRGEVNVLLYNGSLESYYVQHEERIAQLFLMPLTPTIISEVNALSQTGRGDAGFGSTGR